MLYHIRELVLQLEPKLVRGWYPLLLPPRRLNSSVLRIVGPKDFGGRCCQSIIKLLWIVGIPVFGVFLVNCSAAISGHNNRC